MKFNKNINNFLNCWEFCLTWNGIIMNFKCSYIYKLYTVKNSQFGIFYFRLSAPAPHFSPPIFTPVSIFWKRRKNLRRLQKCGAEAEREAERCDKIPNCETFAVYMLVQGNEELFLPSFFFVNCTWNFSL